MEIHNPIFIIGAGRSGTSIFYRMFAMNEELAWFSNYSDRFNNLRFMPYLHKILDLPFLGRILKKNNMTFKSWKFNIEPTEAQRIYHNICRFEYKRKLTENDYEEKQTNIFKSIIKWHLKKCHKNRFVSKQTANNQRLFLLNEIFPDAYYIHIIRDGRAVANSLINVNWWDGTYLWWNGKMVKELVETEDDRLTYACYHWKNEIEEVKRFQKIIKKNKIVTIKYEDFVNNPRETIKLVSEFCGLNTSSSYMDIIPTKLLSQNDKWIMQLSKKQIVLLEKELTQSLNILGYK